MRLANLGVRTLRRRGAVVWLCVAVAPVAAVQLAFARVAGAQAVDRSKRPVAAPAAPFVFPHVGTRTLSNGLRIAVVENHALPVVAVRVVLPVDSVADPIGKEGLYSLTLGMLREGTTSRSADQLAAAVANLGNDVSPVRFTTIASNFGPSLALMADMLMHPAFPAASLARRQAAQVAMLQRQLRAPATVPRKILYSVLFGAEHPLTRSIAASEASIKSISLDDVARFYDHYVAPQNVTIVVAGDVRPADVFAAVSKAFGAWPRRGERYAATIPPAAPTTPMAPTTIYLLDRPNVTQSYVVAGQAGPARTSADYTALEMAGYILGSSSASRLVQNLRGRHSYMYSAAMTAPFWRNAPEPSVIQGIAAFSTPKTDSAMIEWLGEVRAFRGDRPPTADEMAAARAAITAALPAQIETMDRVADRVALLARSGLPFDFDNRVAATSGRLTAADVADVARKYIDPEHMAIVIAGDRKTIEPALKAANIAPIVTVDQTGARLP